MVFVFGRVLEKERQVFNDCFFCKLMYFAFYLDAKGGNNVLCQEIISS